MRSESTANITPDLLAGLTIQHAAGDRPLDASGLAAGVAVLESRRPPSIRFHVGPWIYTAFVSRRPPLLGGLRCMGRCDQRARRIAISPRCPPHRRLWVLLHELAHAWRWEVARPKTEEELCDFTATVCAGAIKDLIAMAAVVAAGPDSSPRGIGATNGQALVPVAHAAVARKIRKTLIVV